MKKRILALASVLALVAVLVAPMAVFAVNPQSDGTGVAGTISTELTLQAPGDIVLPILTIGTHLGESTGSVYSTVAWTMTVAQAAPSSDTPGKLSLAGAGVTPLDNNLGLGIVTGIRTLTVATYQDGLQTLDEAIGTTSIPLFVSQQRVSGDDAAGVYSLTLTYTVTPQ